MGTLLGISFRNLIQSRRRTTLVGVAIAGVTFLLTLLLSLSRGIQDNMIEAATTISSGHVTVAGFFRPTTTSASAILTGRAALRKVVEENTPDLDYLVERHRGWGKIISEQGAVQVGLTGLDAAREDRLFENLSLAKESEYRDGGRDEVLGDARDVAGDGTVILFAGQARQLGVTVGDTLTIKTETLEGQSNTADVRVVAVARDLGLLSGFAVFVPTSLVLDLYRYNDDTTGAFWIYLRDVDGAEEAMGRLREALADAGYTLRDHESEPFFFKITRVRAEDWIGQQVDVTVWKDEVSFLTWILTGFNALTVFLTTLLVGVIAVGIMNAMWTAVRERTREVGTMRAIGLSRGRVLALFLLEAGLLGLLSTTAGATLGAAVALGVDLAGVRVPSQAVQAILLSDTLHLGLSPLYLLGTVAFLTFLTATSALWPSLKAASLTPVRALQHVE